MIKLCTTYHYPSVAHITSLAKVFGIMANHRLLVHSKNALVVNYSIQLRRNAMLAAVELLPLRQLRRKDPLKVGAAAQRPIVPKDETDFTLSPTAANNSPFASKESAI